MGVNKLDAQLLAKMFLAAAKNLEASKEWINDLNVFPVPDGDTGTNMTMTIMSAAGDVSALEDYITKYAAGRQDTGGTWEIEFIMDPQKSVDQIKTLYTASATAKAAGKATWFEVIFPDMSDAFFVVAECGREIPLPEIGQNEAATMSISLIIADYKGLDTKVAFTSGT